MCSFSACVMCSRLAYVMCCLACVPCRFLYSATGSLRFARSLCSRGALRSPGSKNTFLNKQNTKHLKHSSIIRHTRVQVYTHTTKCSIHILLTFWQRGEPESRSEPAREASQVAKPADARSEQGSKLHVTQATNCIHHKLQAAHNTSCKLHMTQVTNCT